MNDFRCGNCKRLLAKIDGKGRVDIVCPKCKTMNVISEVFEFDDKKLTTITPLDIQLQHLKDYEQLVQPFNKTMLTFETKKGESQDDRV